MPGIFISYRREDSAAYAGRLYDRLANHFGKDIVFMDVDSIEPGLDFVEVLEGKISICDAVVVVIGKQWLAATDSDGRRRLDNPEDLVRVEVAAALERKIRVVPALVGGARMPFSHELPDGISLLSRRNALEITDLAFHQNVTRLIETLEKLIAKAQPFAASVPVKQESLPTNPSRSTLPKSDAEDQTEPAPVPVAPVRGTHWRRIKSVIASALTKARIYLVLVARHARGASARLFALAGRRRIEFFSGGAAVVIAVVLLCLFLVARSDFHRGVELATKGDKDGAITEYRASIRFNPFYAVAHENLAGLLFEKGDRKGGISELREVARLKPGDSQAHYDLASELQWEKDGVDEAISQLREAIRLEPDHQLAHYYLGLNLDGKGDIDGALAEYREVIHLKPDDLDARSKLGQALEKKGDLDGAISEYREINRRDPDQGWELLGLALEKKGDLDEAISIYRMTLGGHRLGDEIGFLDPADRSPSSYVALSASNDLASALERKNDLLGARDQYAASCGTRDPPLFSDLIVDRACKNYERLSNTLGLPVQDIKPVRALRKKNPFDWIK